MLKFFDIFAVIFQFMNIVSLTKDNTVARCIIVKIQSDLALNSVFLAGDGGCPFHFEPYQGKPDIREGMPLSTKIVNRLVNFL